MKSITAAMLALALSGWLAGATLAADPSTTPVDPATVSVPDLTFAPTDSDVRWFTDYFYFQKPGVNYGIALADLSECNGYSASLAPMSPFPLFIPMGGAARPGDHSEMYGNAFAMYGLVGVAMLGIVQSGMASGDARGNLRLCMSYKGYQRYGLTRALWKTINKGSDAEIAARFARIASGPAPQAEAIEP